MKPAFFRRNAIEHLGRTSASWTRRADFFLVALAIFGIGLHLLTERTRQLKAQPYLAQKLEAATRAVRCFEAIRISRLGTPAASDKENDPEASGLVGQEFTLVTTDRGVLEAKLTTIDPNFAAVFVQYFKWLDLKAGDPVAIGMTGSFPAWNICLLSAAEELGLKPIVITSVGASMWGANDPMFTWLDMEKLLNDKGLLHTRSVAASLGGSNDRGRGLSPKGRSLLREAIERNGVNFINEPTLEQSVAKRVEIYDREAGKTGVRAYVNIGGGAASIGNASGLISPGVTRRLKPFNWSRRGALHYYARKRVPLIHLVNVETIARAHGLPQVPEVVPGVGEGEIFYRENYDLRIVIPALLTYLLLCFGVLRARQKAAKAAREMESVPVLAGVAGQPVGERSRG